MVCFLSTALLFSISWAAASSSKERPLVRKVSKGNPAVRDPATLWHLWQESISWFRNVHLSTFLCRTALHTLLSCFVWSRCDDWWLHSYIVAIVLTGACRPSMEPLSNHSLHSFDSIQKQKQQQEQALESNIKPMFIDTLFKVTPFSTGFWFMHFIQSRPFHPISFHQCAHCLNPTCSIQNGNTVGILYYAYNIIIYIYIGILI